MATYTSVPGVPLAADTLESMLRESMQSADPRAYGSGTSTETQERPSTLLHRSGANDLPWSTGQVALSPQAWSAIQCVAPQSAQSIAIAQATEDLVRDAPSSAEQLFAEFEQVLSVLTGQSTDADRLIA